MQTIKILVHNLPAPTSGVLFYFPCKIDFFFVFLGQENRFIKYLFPPKNKKLNQKTEWSAEFVIIS